MAPPQTATAAPPRRKKATPKTGKMGRAIGSIILIILSPALLILDALRSGPSHRNTLFAFMLVTSIVIVFTGMAILVTETPTAQLFSLLSRTDAVDETSGMEVPHDKELDAVYKNALKYSVDPHLVLALIKAESNFQPDCVSHRGAKGLMQIMPRTWRHYHPKSQCDGLHRLPIPDHQNDCVFNPEANIETGVHYLAELIRHYHGRVDLAVEAYNAGLMNVVPGERPRFKETRMYVQRIAAFWAEFRNNPVGTKIQMIIGLRKALKSLYITCAALWFILLFWVARRVLPGGKL
ncbi:MAG TPA: lytic transglycosylase domain-containing protein [Bacillota bacterium]|nr:lytic transglycosylase domain-containing protein [Bacillota bacterium]